jgi:hypothetical protein
VVVSVAVGVVVVVAVGAVVVVAVGVVVVVAAGAVVAGAAAWLGEVEGVRWIAGEDVSARRVGGERLTATRRQTVLRRGPCFACTRTHRTACRGFRAR